MDADYKPVSYTDLIKSYENPVDRAWYFTAYQHFNGSLCIPEPIILGISAVPKGNGTYCWKEGSSEISIYGQYTEKPRQYSATGTVSITKANYSIDSPTWPCSAHYDYHLDNLEHEVAHFHPDNETKLYLPKAWDQVDSYLRTGLSTGFSDFVQDCDERGIDIFNINIV